MPQVVFYLGPVFQRLVEHGAICGRTKEVIEARWTEFDFDQSPFRPAYEQRALV